MTKACKAIKRDLRRAACIENLSIQLAHLSSFNFLLRRPMRGIAEALAVLPNLKALRILPLSYHLEDISRILRSPLSGRGHPFLLSTFVCPGELHDTIEPFIRSQSAIMDYSTDGMYIDKKNSIDDLDEADLDHASCLPNIRRFAGASHHIRRVLAGRSVDTVAVIDCGVEDHIQGLYTNFYCYPRVKRDEIVAGDGPQTIARNVCLCLWHVEEQHHFPFLISVSHKISLSRIRSLKLRSWDMPNRDLVPSGLKLFQILEYFEWDSPGCVDEIAANWIPDFILDCAKNAPTLRRITFCNVAHHRIWSRVPVNPFVAQEVATPYVIPKEDPFASQATFLSANAMAEAMLKIPIREGSGFVWTLETRHSEELNVPDTHWEIGS